MPLICPLVEVSGPPGQRGREYGEQASVQIKRGIDHYSRQIEGLRLSKVELKELIDAYLPTIANFDQTYIEEFKGIAEGAQVAFEDIVLLNARTEVLKLARRPDLKQRIKASIDASPDGCTAIVVLPKASRTGALIHAHNWDWKHDSAEASVILRIIRDDGPDILTFTEAGALARFGINSAGISLSANYLECDRDYSQVGVPLALIRRKILEQKYLALAMRAAHITPKSGSNNLVISHADGMALDFECAPNESFTLAPVDGLIVHANHWQSLAALSKLKDTGIDASPCSLYRDLRARELLTPHIGAITTDIVKQVLADEFQTPWSICRPPRANSFNDQTATVATLVMNPASGTMEVAMLPALGQYYAGYSIKAGASAILPSAG